MTHTLNLLETLRRPRLLIRAARIGLMDYRREAALRRLLGFGHPAANDAALEALMEVEAEMDAQRRARDAAYSPARHVDVMIAVMGEARLLRASLTEECHGFAAARFS